MKTLVLLLMFGWGCGGGSPDIPVQAKSSEFLAVEQCLGLPGDEPPVVYEPAVRCVESGLMCCLASYRERRTADQPLDAVSYFLWDADNFSMVFAQGDEQCAAYHAANHTLQVEMCNALRWQAGDFRDCWDDRGTLNEC